jgi:hypothetical protein
MFRLFPVRNKEVGWYTDGSAWCWHAKSQEMFLSLCVVILQGKCVAKSELVDFRVSDDAVLMWCADIVQAILLQVRS